ncbi:hypothetical protein CJD41_24125 (plasmid) [Salmonella enterica subsp. enterica serovar Pullorum]|nr:hypothetical protein CJD41_24125 [Salmonella enterica subsp. enterica serovar Pullorum]
MASGSSLSLASGDGGQLLVQQLQTLFQYWSLFGLIARAGLLALECGELLRPAAVVVEVAETAASLDQMSPERGRSQLGQAQIS